MEEGWSLRRKRERQGTCVRGSESGWGLEDEMFRERERERQEGKVFRTSIGKWDG